MEALALFLEKLRSFEHTRNSIFVFIIEKNHCSIKARDIADVCCHFQPCVFMYEGDGAEMNVPGVWMSPRNNDKERIQRHANAFLFSKRVHFHHPFLSNSKTEKHDLIEQAKAYRRTARETLHPEFTETKWVYSGKRKGLKDDRIVCLQLMLFWMTIFYSEERYCGWNRVRILNGLPLVQLSDNPNSKRRLTIKNHQA
jgi:hypothetical protein